MNTKQAPTSIAPRDLHPLLQAVPGPELLDVRTAPEYQNCHVPGARLVPLDDLNATSYLTMRPPGAGPLYILCQSGGRARKAAEKFRQAGFENCVVVEGGTQAWIDCGLPVERGRSKVLPLLQQVQITVGSIAAAGALLALTVNPLFAVLPLLIGCGLVFAGLTGTCAMASLLARMPWNRGDACGTGCDSM